MPATAKVTQTHAAPQVDHVTAQAAAWSALAKIAAKEAESRRDDLPAGYSSHVDIHLSAAVDGAKMVDSFGVALTVGHETTRAGGGPSADDVLAWVLSKIGRPEVAEKLLGELSADFTANDGKLPANDAVAAKATGILKVLRSTRKSTVRGSVSAKIERSAEPTFSLVR